MSKYSGYLEQLNTVDSSSAMKQFEALSSVMNSASMKQFEALGSVMNSVSLKQFEAINSAINPIWIKQSEYLNSLYTVQELSEFSDVLSDVGQTLQQGNISEKEIEKALKKLPSFFLLFLQYLFNYVVMPLFVVMCLQPLLTEYLQNNDEPRRVQKNSIKKIPQRNGIETTAVNRFISGDGVHLRASASIKSEVISHLDFGQLVYVLKKERSWIKVSIPHKSGTPIEGWVFNEYTERFKN